MAVRKWKITVGRIGAGSSYTGFGPSMPKAYASALAHCGNYYIDGGTIELTGADGAPVILSQDSICDEVERLFALARKDMCAWRGPGFSPTIEVTDGFRKAYVRIERIA